jgi:3-hydroxyacyl-CoA dehydrogenase/enoyl-CoA hydratase/3-hydroxybutyryl-CoA epimerase/enoyl-CoA isomerase
MLYQGTTLTVAEIEPGIAELCFDQRGAAVNTLGQHALRELGEALQRLSASRGLQGLLLVSAKTGFIAGADVTEFTALFAAADTELSAQIAQAHTVLNALEDLPVPTVAAINGSALGGGFELCLSADFRVAADTATVGLPEVKLGIHPGFGGTVRLPRLIGCDNANEWIGSGAEKTAAQALAAGAVDAVVAPEQLRAAALDLLRQCAQGKLDYQHRRDEKQAPVLLNDIERMMAFMTAKALVAAQAGPHMPAPVAAVKAMEKSAGLARAPALEVETRSFVKLVKTPQAEALIGVFLNNQALAKHNRRFEQQARPVQRGGVLGAGIMGGGIAYQSALKGVPVLMKDVAEQGLQAGIAEAAKQLTQRVDRARMTPAQMAEVLGHIRPTLDYQGFGQLDIAVEAVVENAKVKKSVLAECEAQMDAQAVLASNTSTISITELAGALQRPQQFCGMHFFNPVHRMPLVEVIRGRDTADATVATVINYAKTMGKTPIVVNDCAGFFVNRVLFPYFIGFNLLMRDGADFRQVDRVMEKFGWPMGPAFLLDVVGIDTADHTTPVMAAAYPERMAFAGKPLHTLFFEQKRYGQKNGRGFYLHTLDRKGKPQKREDPEALALVATYQQQQRDFADEEIVARLMVPMCIEAARCLEEGIVGSAAEADMGLLLGIGFPPFRGGALRYIEQMGVAEFCALADRYAELGNAYVPTEKLRQMAATAGRFFGA